MRSILISVMLVVVTVTIYSTTIGGPDGSDQHVKHQGDKVSRSIESISP